MEFFHILVLSVVQGITEFLPISSSAHLVFVPKLLGWTDQGLIFDISLHFGTLGAVMVYFRKDVAAMFIGGFSLLRGRYRDDGARLLLNLVFATLPIVIAGALFKSLIELHARDLVILAFTSIVFGLLLWYADKRAAPLQPTLKSANDITVSTAFIWGLYQMFALVPGVSRSGICVTGGRALGATRELAGHFGSLMAIPTILAAVILSLADIGAEMNWYNAGSTLLLGSFLSFLCALVGIDILVRWCARIGYLPFVIYRLVLGVAILVLFAS